MLKKFQMASLITLIGSMVTILGSLLPVFFQINAIVFGIGIALTLVLLFAMGVIIGLLLVSDKAK